METVRRKILARFALAGFALVCVVWLAGLDYGRKVSTNVLDLLPAAENSPEAGLVRSLADDAQARVMLFALRDPAAAATPPVAAARRLAAELGRSPAFADAMVLDEAAPIALGRALFARRYTLLLPSWLGRQQAEFSRTGLGAGEFSAWLAERSAARLEGFLARPEAVPMEDLVTADPLLLVAGFAQGARDLSSPGSAAGGHALVWARIKESPLAEEGQGPVFAVIGQAFAHVSAAYPGVELRWSGINRFAAASRARIQAELGVLNIASILAVLGIACALVRRTRKLLHLLPVISISLLGAWTISTFVFDRVHILAFVIGSLLSGVAIDYGFYIFMQPPSDQGERYGDKLRRLLKPLLASCLTTVIGFSLLLFSELPLLREVGLFVASGLLCALAAAMLYFAQLDRPFLESRGWGRLPGLPGGLRRPARVALILCVLAAGFAGLRRLRWRDDVRELDVPSPSLRANDGALRELFGDVPGRRVYLTYGATIADARQSLERFVAYEGKAAPGTALVSLGLAFPTESDWRALPARLAGLGRFGTDFRAALGRHGFAEPDFDGFVTEWEGFRSHPPAGAYDALFDDFSRSMKGPFALFGRAGKPLSWFLTVGGEGQAPRPPPALNTVGVDQLESLNGLFARYRRSALKLSLAGLALVIASVFAIYRGRRAVRIALIPSGSCFLVFGLFGLFGQTLNLFHLLGAFLGVCLAHNYAIFTSGSAAAGDVPFASVRLSGLCAAASFGVLGFSGIPVIHALGVTVATIVLVALAVLELEGLVRTAKP